MHSDDDLPSQCIVFDKDCARAPFYLRIAIPNGVRHVELADANGAAMSLPAAVQVCVRDGLDPTHWLTVGGGLSVIPSSIARRPASPARKD